MLTSQTPWNATVAGICIFDQLLANQQILGAADVVSDTYDHSLVLYVD